MNRVPNLLRLRSAKESGYLYQDYLTRLMQSSRWDRTLEACRQIRSYAARHGRPRLADFTYHFEIDALCHLGEYSSAWRQLRRLERIAYGRSVNLKAKSWRSDELDWFLRYHPQILYFLGRYRMARRLYEAILGKLFKRSRSGASYEILPYVYNSIRRPKRRQHVTLFHIYRALGESLLKWSEWKQFVEGFHPKLFKVARVQRERLLQDPSLLRHLYERVEAEQNQRLTAGVSTGESDLTDPPAKVRRRQERLAAKIARLRVASAEHELQLRKIFPELRSLPH